MVSPIKKKKKLNKKNYCAGNVAGAWTVKRNAHINDDLTRYKWNGTNLPTIFFSLNLVHRLPFEEQMITSIEKLNYPLSKIYFYVQVSPSREKLVKQMLKYFFKKLDEENGMYEVQVTNNTDFNFNKICSLKKSILQKSDFYFTTASILKYQDVLLDLVNTGKKVIAPLLNNLGSEEITNFWPNYTDLNTFQPSFYYDQLASAQYNGIWAVPVILNTFLLKNEVFHTILDNLVRSNQKYTLPDQSIQSDFELSRVLIQNSIFPMLLNKRSYGDYLGDYTFHSTNLFLKPYNPLLWNAHYLIQNNFEEDTILFNVHQRTFFFFLLNDSSYSFFYLKSLLSSCQL